jgi:hypothetical protein
LRVNGSVVEAFRRFYGDEGGTEADKDGSVEKPRSEPEVFAIWGSAGFLELSVNGGSAAEHLGAKRGDPVIASALSVDSA